MPQPIYGWVSQGAKQGKSRTRPMPDYKQAASIVGGQIVSRPNLGEIQGPVWDGVPPNQ